MTFNVFGLPLHPLIVHLTVVLIPVVALALIVESVWPRTRRVLRWPTVVGAVAAVAVVFITTQAGDHLSRQLPVSDLINRHADLGGQLQYFVIGLAVAAVVLLVLTSPKLADKRTNIVLVVVCVLSVLVSGAAVVQVVRIGHSGATAAWNGVGDLPVR
jgi:hypothetical protein